MKLYSGWMISAILFLISSFASVLTDPPTLEQFNRWGSSRICTDPALKDHLGEICVREGNVRKGSKKAKMIKKECGCNYKVNMQFTNESGSITTERYEKGVGLCCYSSNKMKCIAKGPNINTILVYEVSKDREVCKDPVQKSYDFSATLPSKEEEEAEKGGFSSFCRWFASLIGL